MRFYTIEEVVRDIDKSGDKARDLLRFIVRFKKMNENGPMITEMAKAIDILYPGSSTSTSIVHTLLEELENGGYILRTYPDGSRRAGRMLIREDAE